MKKCKLFCALFFAASLFATASHARVLEVHGFVEPAFTSELYQTIQTFSVEDGALYFSGDYEGFSYLLDLPFDIGATSTTLFAIPTAKVQTYLNRQYPGGLYWELGKFDKIFGYEGNDGRAIAYTSHGVIYNNLRNTSHMGFLFGYQKGMIDLSGLISNNKNTVRQSASGTFDFGAKLAIKKGSFFFKNTFLYNKIQPNGSDILNNTILGAHFSKAMAAAEFYYNKVTNVKSMTGLGLYTTYNLNEKIAFALRGDYYSQFSPDKTYQVTVGANYKFGNNVRLKTDYSFRSTKTTSTSNSVSRHIFGLAGDFEF